MFFSRKKKLLSKLRGLVKNEIRISHSHSDAPLDVYASRFGGLPAVPADFAWPRFSFTWSRHHGVEPQEGEKIESLPLAFIAQINLKDVAELDKDNLLPKSGTLCFFYELETMEWGFDPLHKGCARVFYFPEESELTIAEYPDDLDEEYQIPEYALEFKKHVSLPGDGEFDGLDDFEDKDDYEHNAYYDCCAELGYGRDEWEDNTKLLGYPNVIQYPMEEECEAVTRGFYMGGVLDEPQPSEEEKVEIKEAAKDWMLLFQMGTIDEEDYDLMFDDGGYIYFWIKKEDLQNCNFDNAWLVLQCE